MAMELIESRCLNAANEKETLDRVLAAPCRRPVRGWEEGVEGVSRHSQEACQG